METFKQKIKSILSLNHSKLLEENNYQKQVAILSQTIADVEVCLIVDPEPPQPIGKP